MGRPKGKELSDGEYEVYFNSHVKEDESGCYLWTAAKNNIGYGMFRYKNGMASAHRVRMALDGHDIENKVVYHKCANYHCVNPQHLRIGTNFDKSQMMLSRGTSSDVITNPKYHKTCKHCGYHGPQTVYHRRHDENCKHKP